MNDIEKQKFTEDVMREIGLGIDSVLKDLFIEKMGFMLVIFGFNQPGIGNYISNAQTQDTIKALRECADRLEAKEDIPPGNGIIQ